MYILGISCFYDDAAAAIIKDGQLLAAAQEERFTRRKHDFGFPSHAINYCLSEAGITAKDLDYVGFYDKPLLKFERILFTYLATFPRSLHSFFKTMPAWIKERLWLRQLIRKELSYNGPILFSEHHFSHAASAFLVSPYKEAAILTVDGVGEWETTTLGVGRGNKIHLLKSLHFPHSLGLLYSAFTYYLGFKVNSGENKVMGLAPYGKPVYYDLILKELVSLREDGSFKINMKFFAYDHGLTMTNRKFDELFGAKPRQPESALVQFHKDIAASVQKVTDEIMVRMANYLHTLTKMNYLCMAGGVALNCVSNTRILHETPFEDLFIQPAAGDAGGAVGVAYYVHNTLLDRERTYVWIHDFLGPEFSEEEIEELLQKLGIEYQKLDRQALLEETARLIAEQNVIGWFQGKMEFGPRALGSRSILADARNPKNQLRVNLKVKFRESFCPFAPAVLFEKASEYFEFDRPSPHMLFTAQVKKNNKAIPAVTHVDGSARLQTLVREDNVLFYDLIKTFERLTGCPVLINTSFNVRGEPIVCTPSEALRCFMRANMDYLVLGSCLLDKEKINNDSTRIAWEEVFDLD